MTTKGNASDKLFHLVLFYFSEGENTKNMAAVDNVQAVLTSINSAITAAEAAATWNYSTNTDPTAVAQVGQSAIDALSSEIENYASSVYALGQACIAGLNQLAAVIQSDDYKSLSGSDLDSVNSSISYLQSWIGGVTSWISTSVNPYIAGVRSAVQSAQSIFSALQAELSEANGLWDNAMGYLDDMEEALAGAVPSDNAYMILSYWYDTFNQAYQSASSAGSAFYGYWTNTLDPFLQENFDPEELLNNIDSTNSEWLALLLLF